MLIVGSGQITHNLHAADFSARPGDTDPHVAEFTGWFEARMATHDLDALLDYRQQAPYAVSMHPSDEHLLPVFAALGAADDDYKLEIHAQGIYQRSLAMTHYVLSHRRMGNKERHSGRESVARTASSSREAALRTVAPSRRMA